MSSEARETWRTTGNSTGAADALDRLLVDFFRRERPAEIDLLPDPPPDLHSPYQTQAAGLRHRPVHRRASGNARAPRARSLAVAVVASAIVVAMLGLWGTSIQRTGDTGPDGLAASSDQHGHHRVADGSIGRHAGVDRSLPGMATSTIDRDERLNYLTDQGPVEQRNTFSTRRNRIFDSHTGNEIELVIPQLEIKIYPIDDEDSQKTTDSPTKQNSRKQQPGKQESGKGRN